MNGFLDFKKKDLAPRPYAPLDSKKEFIAPLFGIIICAGTKATRQSSPEPLKTRAKSLRFAVLVFCMIVVSLRTVYIRCKTAHDIEKKNTLVIIRNDP